MATPWRPGYGLGLPIEGPPQAAASDAYAHWPVLELAVTWVASGGGLLPEQLSLPSTMSSSKPLSGPVLLLNARLPWKWLLSMATSAALPATSVLPATSREPQSSSPTEYCSPSVVTPAATFW